MGSAFSRTSMGQRDLRFLRFTGLSAWIVWAAVHIYFLIGFANRFFVILQWGFAFLTKRRQVRVFPGQENAAKAPKVPANRKTHLKTSDARSGISVRV